MTEEHRALFWKVVEQAGRAASAAGLAEAFAQRDRQSLIAAKRGQDAILDDMDCENVLKLATSVSGAPLTDDNFLYFRARLAALGRSVVERVIAEPSVLLDETLCRQLADDEEQWEDYLYCIADAFEARFGESIYDHLEEEL